MADAQPSVEVPPPPGNGQSFWTPSNLAEHAQKLPIAKRDPELLARGLEAIARWHERFPPAVWSRITKTGGEGATRRMPKVLKELDEISPILRQVEGWLETLPADSAPARVVDLCSGYGFLGMFLAELVPDAARLYEVVLVDRGWPNPHIGSKGKISWDHIKDHGAWRVPLGTIRSDVKSQCDVRAVVERVVACDDRPCMICAVHLCGTLSLRAAQIFNASARAHALALVPCCMPPKEHNNKDVVYSLGGHTFAATAYRDKEILPTARDRFKAWVSNVAQTVNPGEDGETRLEAFDVGQSNAQDKCKGESYRQDQHIFAFRAPWGTYTLPPVQEEGAAAGQAVVTEARWLPGHVRPANRARPTDELAAATADSDTPSIAAQAPVTES